jgi:hypothetical protein
MNTEGDDCQRFALTGFNGKDLDAPPTGAGRSPERVLHFKLELGRYDRISYTNLVTDSLTGGVHSAH